MGTMLIRRMPCAYALWLRDSGSSREQIAHVLGVGQQQVDEVLRLAECEVDRGKRSRSVPSVVTFVDDESDTSEQAIAVSREPGSVLHLVALHRTPRPKLFAVGDSSLRKGARIREGAEAMLIASAEKALARGVRDVVPHAMSCSRDEAVRIISKTWGELTVPDTLRAKKPRVARGLRWRVAVG